MRTLRALCHPHVVSYHECFFEGGRQFIAMEYCEVCLLGRWDGRVCLGGGRQFIAMKCCEVRVHLWVFGEGGGGCECVCTGGERNKAANALSTRQRCRPPPTPTSVPHPQEGDLQGVIDGRKGSLLGEDEAMLLFVQLALALQHVHAQARARRGWCSRLRHTPRAMRPIPSHPAPRTMQPIP